MGRQLYHHRPSTGQWEPLPLFQTILYCCSHFTHSDTPGGFLGPIFDQQLYNVESEIEETDYDSLEETSSIPSTEEWEDESDSWETDNGLTTEDDGHAHNASDTATPTPTPTASSPYIIPPAEGGRGQQSPSRATSSEETDEAASSAASAGRTIWFSDHLDQRPTVTQ